MNWDAVSAILAAFVGSAAVYAAFTANRMAKRQRQDAERVQAQQRRVRALALAMPLYSAFQELGFAVHLLRNAQAASDDRRAATIRGLDYAIAASARLAGLQPDLPGDTSGLDEDIAIAVSAVQTMQDRMRGMLSLVADAKAAAPPQSFQEAAVVVIRNAQTALRLVNERIARDFGVHNPFTGEASVP